MPTFIGKLFGRKNDDGYINHGQYLIAKAADDINTHGAPQSLSFEDLKSWHREGCGEASLNGLRGRPDFATSSLLFGFPNKCITVTNYLNAP